MTKVTRSISQAVKTTSGAGMTKKRCFAEVLRLIKEEKVWQV